MTVEAQDHIGLNVLRFSVKREAQSERVVARSTLTQSWTRGLGDIWIINSAKKALMKHILKLSKKKALMKHKFKTCFSLFYFINLK